MSARSSIVTLVLVALLATVRGAPAASGPTLDAMIHAYLAERGATVQLARPTQLARRYALDLTGVVPSLASQDAAAQLAPAEMFDHFRAIGPLPHTGGEDAYVWVNLLADADHFLYSNSAQFSQVAHIREFQAQLRRVYAEGWSYQEFARWAMESQMFLSRFPSGADRANAAFFLFLGRFSLTVEVPVGNMWNGWQLRDPNIDAVAAETDPDFHVYDYDPAHCTSGEVLCTAELWTTVGDTPADAIETMISSPLFAEAVVDRYWQRLMGTPMQGDDFPEIRQFLVEELIAHDYDVNWLIREIATSAAYAQEMSYR